MVKKLYHVEFGPPEGNKVGWFGGGFKDDKIFVFAESYAKAAGVAMRWSHENAESVVGEDGSIRSDEYRHNIRSIVLISDKIIE